MFRPGVALRFPRLLLRNRPWRPLQPHREPLDRPERDRLRQSVLNLHAPDADTASERADSITDTSLVHDIAFETPPSQIKFRQPLELAEIMEFFKERNVTPLLHSHRHPQDTPFPHQILVICEVGRLRRALISQLQAASRSFNLQIDDRDEEWMVVVIGSTVCIHLQSEEANQLYQLPRRWIEIDTQPISSLTPPPPRKSLKAGRAFQ